MIATDLRRRMNDNPKLAMLALGALVTLVGVVTQVRLSEELTEVRNSIRQAALSGSASPNRASTSAREPRAEAKSASRALSDMQSLVEELAGGAEIDVDSTEPLGAEALEGQSVAGLSSAGQARVGLRVQFSSPYSSALEFITRITAQSDLVCGAISIRRQTGDEAGVAVMITVYSIFWPNGPLSEAANVR